MSKQVKIFELSDDLEYIETCNTWLANTKFNVVDIKAMQSNGDAIMVIYEI